MPGKSLAFICSGSVEVVGVEGMSETSKSGRYSCTVRQPLPHPHLVPHDCRQCHPHDLSGWSQSLGSSQISSLYLSNSPPRYQSKVEHCPGPVESGLDSSSTIFFYMKWKKHNSIFEQYHSYNAQVPVFRNSPLPQLSLCSGFPTQHKLFFNEQ